jgi:hypothetical protein
MKQRKMKNKVDFSNYQFRCSQLGKLMTNPRAKKDKLSVTTMSYLQEVYIAEVFNREREIESKYLDKGNYAEEDSLTLVTSVFDRLLVKNKDHLKNEFITGTPDVVEKDNVLDIKTSWDIWSFAKADGKNKDYYWQLQGYMNLTNKKKAILAYTLVDTPIHLIVDEQKRRAFHAGIMDNDSELAKLEEAVEQNMIFSKDIPEEMRVKTFAFDYDEAGIAKLQERIVDCREYLNSLTGL